jgi:hypothetical protein
MEAVKVNSGWNEPSIKPLLGVDVIVLVKNGRYLICDWDGECWGFYDTWTYDDSIELWAYFTKPDGKEG